MVFGICLDDHAGRVLFVTFVKMPIRGFLIMSFVVEGIYESAAVIH